MSKRYSLWIKASFKIDWKWFIIILIEIIGNAHSINELFPKFDWYWHCIVLIIILHWIFMVNANNIYKKDMKIKDMEIHKNMLKIFKND